MTSGFVFEAVYAPSGTASHKYCTSTVDVRRRTSIHFDARRRMSKSVDVRRLTSAYVDERRGKRQMSTYVDVCRQTYVNVITSVNVRQRNGFNYTHLRRRKLPDLCRRPSTSVGVCRRASTYVNVRCTSTYADVHRRPSTHVNVRPRTSP